MVAQNTYVSPLWHHLKNLRELASSSKSFTRIQSEMHREGFEVYKDNLLTLPLTKKNKVPFAENSEVIDISSTQTEPLLASRKTGLESCSMEKHAMSHGDIAQPHKQETAHWKLIDSSEKGSLLAAGNFEHPSSRAISSSFTILCFEGNYAYQADPEMFRQSYSPLCACVTTSLHPRQEYSWKCLSNVGSVEADVETEAGNGKRLKYFSSGADGTHMLSSSSVVEGSRMRPSQLTSNKVCLNVNAGVLNREAKNRGGFATSCGTSVITDTSEAPSGVVLMPFTNSVHAEMPKTLSTVSEGEPSFPHSLEHLQQQDMKMQKTPVCEVPCADADWGKFLALSATPVAKDAVTDNAKVLPFQQRFKQLQDFLKQCDKADQNRCIHALRSLSAAARSGHAVELETRAIRLSLEEGKEIRRMRLLNVLGKISEQNLEDAGATPQGPRLPAPGVAPRFKTVTQ